MSVEDGFGTRPHSAHSRAIGCGEAWAEMWETYSPKIHQKQHIQQVSVSDSNAKMTTYIPSLTLPSAILANPAYSILLPVTLGTAVGFSTRPKETQDTYLALRQPPFRPPPWVFGPAWTALYGLMGYSAFRAWANGINSFDVGKVKLAKVSNSQSYSEYNPVYSILIIMSGRSNSLHNSTRP